MNGKGIVKIEIDESNILQTKIYEANYPIITRVIEDKAVYPTFDYNNGKLMRDTPTDISYFDVAVKTINISDAGLSDNGVVLTIKENYPYEAITIPATYKNGNVISNVIGIDCAKRRTKYKIQMEIDELEREQTKNHTYSETEYNQLHLALEVEKQNAIDLRSVFVQNNNSIKFIIQNAFMYYSNLEYFDFPRLTSLLAIGDNPTKNLSQANAAPRFAIQDITLPNASTTYSHIEGTFYCCSKLGLI